MTRSEPVPAPELSIVVPCHNESAHLAESLRVIGAVLAGLGRSFELIVVDDGSSDATWSILSESNAPGLVALRLSRRFGKELALCAGLERARGAAVIVMDGDLQHPPELIGDMVRAWAEEGYDVVEGVKSERGRDAAVSRGQAGLFYWVLTRLSGFDLAGASDFKLLDRRVLDAWMQMGERNVFFRGMSAWLGFRRKQLPFAVAPRAGGQTAWTPGGLLRLAVTGVTSYSSLPLHLITWMGGAFLVFAVLLGGYALVKKVTGGAVDGFTTVIVLQLAIGSMLMIGLGILGTYVSRVYDEVKRRPRYVVAEALGADRADERSG
jgi:glycosyltransferase involved in cell wall biosynthesis